MRMPHLNFYARSFLAATIVIAVVLTIFYFLNTSKDIEAADILIPNVPYHGIYTYDPRVGTAAAALYSVLQYWTEIMGGTEMNGATLSLASLDKIFPIRQYNPVWDLKVFIDSLGGYKAEVVRLPTIDRVADYMAKENVPLLSAVSPAPNYPGRYTIYRVFVGAFPSKKLLVAHDPLFGPAYAFTFAELSKSYPRGFPENLKFYFLAIKPKDLRQSTPPLSPQPYPNRKEFDRFLPLVLKWQEARDMSLTPATKLALWNEILANPLFGELSPPMRLYAYTGLAENYLVLGRLDEAEKFANMAVAVNKNLSQPWGIWTYFRQNEIARPWVRLGQVYMARGEDEKALNAFRRALEIEPDHPDLQETKMALEALAKR